MRNGKIIGWWKTSFGEREIRSVVRSIRSGSVSQGAVTREFEKKLEKFLGIEHVVAVSSGSSALLAALMAIDFRPGDEAIIPNRTWISTAHAVHLLGGKVIPVDVEESRPVMDCRKIVPAITRKTRVILPVHMNGRSADMAKIVRIAHRHGLMVIEDAAQAFGSSNTKGYLGTQSDIGCFSLSVAKIIATGQGGFAATNNQKLAGRLRAVRTHGVENVRDPGRWVMPGFNFRFTDVAASIGIEQLRKIPGRIARLKQIYKKYDTGLKNSPFTIIPVNLQGGEVPVYAEFLVKDRASWIKILAAEGIETRPFYPAIDDAKYLKIANRNHPHSRKYAEQGIYLPSGPGQNMKDIEKVILKIKKKPS